MDVQIRWLIRRDIPEVLQIESSSFTTAWSEEDFIYCLRQRNCIGMVAEANHQVVGFMIYELHKAKLHILNFAVAPEFRRIGVGSLMIHRMIDKLSRHRRKEIALTVRENNLLMQQFLRSNGFLCVGIEREAYPDTDEDAYEFCYFAFECEAAL